MFRPRLHSNEGRPRRDVLLLIGLRLAGLISAVLVMLVFVFVAREAWPALRTLGPQRLLGDGSWHPTSGLFDLRAMIVGTLVITVGSLLVTAPLGFASGIFVHFYAPRAVAGIFRRVVELLAGVPSVVFGLWGLTCVVPLVERISPLGQGQSLLAGVIILSMMTLPIVAMSVDAALTGVAREHLRAAASLGLSRRVIALQVAVPAAAPGIITGIILQTARALGETMAVLMVCGNIAQIPGSIFEPIRVLTANIALEMGYADDDHRSALFASGLILFVMVAVLVLIAELIDRRRVDGTVT